uniref:Uncharacterized protein n=1 Tax=Anguilla anguilla TaxID=7936 RepID=A0A0E9XK59_ANGAN
MLLQCYAVQLWLGLNPWWVFKNNLRKK